jgi:hypothetical protein
LNRREEQSVMWRHACEKHGGDIPSFVMNVTSIFRDDAMLRQITEAVLIGSFYWFYSFYLFTIWQFIEKVRRTKLV